MQIPTHWVHIGPRFQDLDVLPDGYPVITNNSQYLNRVRRYRATKYKHRIAAIGGFDTASCELDITRIEAERIFESAIGWQVQVFVENGVAPVWEGFVNRIMLMVGNAMLTVSMDGMVNRASALTKAPGNVASENAVVNNSDSQSQYGIIERVYQAGLRQTGSTLRDGIRDQMIAQRALPQSSVAFASDRGIALGIEMMGLWHTLEWQKVPSQGASSLSAQIASRLAAWNNDNLFFNNQDASLIDTNTSYAHGPNRLTGETFKQQIESLCQAGDGGNRWVAGLTPQIADDYQRRFYYRQADGSTKYIAYARDGMRPRYPSGRLVRPWEVTPDGFLRVVDVFPYWTEGITFDPRVAYLSAVEYDMESQRVTWVSDDDITADGSFKLRDRIKTFGSRWEESPYKSIS